MKTIKFILKIVKGNPVPYLRMTQGQVKLMRIPDHKLSPKGLEVKNKIRRYLNWKEFVNDHTYGMDFERSPKTKIYLDVFIYFGNKKHADPENVRKSIQDSIFKNDKMVAGNVDFDYDKENPRCEITIYTCKKRKLNEKK